MNGKVLIMVLVLMLSAFAGIVSAAPSPHLGTNSDWPLPPSELGVQTLPALLPCSVTTEIGFPHHYFNNTVRLEPNGRTRPILNGTWAYTSTVWVEVTDSGNIKPETVNFYYQETGRSSLIWVPFSMVAAMCDTLNVRVVYDQGTVDDKFVWRDWDKMSAHLEWIVTNHRPQYKPNL